MRVEKPVRGWMFWRKAFWTRPVFLLVLGIGAVAAIPFLALDGYHDVRNQHLVEDQRFCGEHAAPCLERIVARLEGPYTSRRDIGQEWSAWIGSEKLDDFHVRYGYQDALASVQDSASVDTADGDVVAVETPDGYVPVWGLGVRGAVRAVVLILGCAGAAVAAVGYSVRKARAHDSWWSVRGPYVYPGSRAGSVLLGPASVALVLILFGVAWWQAWIAGWLAATVYALVWIRRRSVEHFGA